uniref:Uncharacterized protein n=1 Tax=Anguilla anguilla TaxID=7936 RepID=A0A0E9XJX9_ANGAN
MPAPSWNIPGDLFLGVPCPDQL